MRSKAEFHDAMLDEHRLCIDEVGAIRTARKPRIGGLNRVIFPVANWTDFVAARRFVEDDVATTWAGKVRHACSPDSLARPSPPEPKV